MLFVMKKEKNIKCLVKKRHKDDLHDEVFALYKIINLH